MDYSMSMQMRGMQTKCLSLYENSRFRPESFICAPIFARFSLPIQKFPYRPFTKGTC